MFYGIITGTFTFYVTIFLNIVRDLFERLLQNIR
jgi:hypothetical protein